MYTLFSRNSWVSLALLVPLLVVLRLRMALQPVFYVLQDTPEQTTPLWDTFFGHVVAGGPTWTILGFVAPLVCALMVSNLVNRYDMVDRENALGGLFFLLLMGQIRPSIGFHPAMIFCILLSMTIDRFFSAVRKDRPSVSVAWGFAYATFGGLLWGKGVWFLPFLFVLLFILRISSGRTLAAALLGVVGSVVLTCGVASVAGADLFGAWAEQNDAMFATTPFWRTGWRSWLHMSLCALTVLFAVLNAQRRMTHQTIIVHRQLRVAVWIVFFGVFLMMLPAYSYETQIIASVGAAMIVPQFVGQMRDIRLREGLTLTLFVVDVWYLWL